jgi:hypothetical protein
LSKQEFSLEELPNDQIVEGFGVVASVLKEAKSKANASKVFIVKIEDDCFLVRRPKTDEFDRFMAAAKAEGIKYSVEARNLSRACVLYPDKPAFQALIEEQPGLGMAIAGELLTLAGLSKNTELKKF